MVCGFFVLRERHIINVLRYHRSNGERNAIGSLYLIIYRSINVLGDINVKRVACYVSR